MAKTVKINGKTYNRTENKTMAKRRKKQGNTPADSRQRAGTLVEDYNKLAEEFRILKRENEKLRESVREWNKINSHILGIDLK